MTKNDLIELIMEARYGKENIKNATEYQKILFDMERAEFSKSNKLQLAVYLSVNHNIQVEM